MDCLSQLCERLCDLNYLRRVVYYASDRPGWWAKTFFGDRLSSLVYTIKVEQEDTLASLFSEDDGFWSMLASGRMLGFEARVVPWLDFSSDGRTAASLALLAFIVDGVDKCSELNPAFILEAVCGPVCHKLKTILAIQRLKERQRDIAAALSEPVVEEVE